MVRVWRGFVFQWSAQRARGVRFSMVRLSMVCPTGLEGVHFSVVRPTSEISTARAPCYMCYMCYMGLTRQPAELPHCPGSLLHVLYGYMGLTRQPAELPHCPGSLLYVHHMGLTRQPAELYTIHIASHMYQICIV